MAAGINAKWKRMTPFLVTISMLLLIVPAMAETSIIPMTDHAICSDRRYLVRTIRQTEIGKGYDGFFQNLSIARNRLNAVKPSPALAQDAIDYLKGRMEALGSAYVSSFVFRQASWIQEIPASTTSGLGSRCRVLVTFDAPKLHKDLLKMRNAALVAAQNNPGLSPAAREFAAIMDDVLEKIDIYGVRRPDEVRLTFDVFNDRSNDPIVHVIDQSEYF